MIVNGQILSVLKELSAHHMSIFSFLGDSFCKCQWIFTKLGMCFDIVEIWFWIANRQISSFFFSGLSARDTFLFSFQDNNLSKSQWIFTKLDMCIDIVEICF